MSTAEHAEKLQLGIKLNELVLNPMKQVFVGKDEIIDLLGISLVARENLFLLGPPGTAKSALVQELARRIEGNVFDYLLTRFTEPNEIFGPFDIRKLREGELVTNTEGMLPEATFVFLDELLNANSAILNSLLLALNERIFRRGREKRSLPTLAVIGASNRLPEDDALGALFDRFLLRVRCDNVAADKLSSVLISGWKLDLEKDNDRAKISVEEIRGVHELIQLADMSAIRSEYVSLVHRLRQAGIMVSDRRAVKLQRLLAASALLCGRFLVNRTDLWVLRYIWDTEEQQDVLATIVGDVINKADSAERATGHARSKAADVPDPETLARDLELISAKLEAQPDSADQSFFRDQLGVLAARCQWIQDEQPRQYLASKVNTLLEQFGDNA